MITYAFTCGDVNGIGPEICLRTFNKILPKRNYRVVYFCPANVFIDSCQNVNPGFEFIITKKWADLKNSTLPLTVYDIGNSRISAGKPTKTSGKTAYKSIELAHKSIVEEISSAMITAPISKTAFKLAGINFPGHTELLAGLSKVKNYAMMFLSDEYFAAIATIHEPIKSVSSKITKRKLKTLFETVEHTLIRDFNISSPNIGVLGLNPHAGENGQIGKEEINVIEPAIKEFNSTNISGPFVADAYYRNKMYRKFDITIGMYHDQVLIPFKMTAVSLGVNYTAGLPIVRTSPDHGTAYNIAWQNKASSKSMFAAFRWTQKIVKNRISNGG